LRTGEAAFERVGIHGVEPGNKDAHVPAFDLYHEGWL
jgi:hypothetical protein